MANRGRKKRMPKRKNLLKDQSVEIEEGVLQRLKLKQLVPAVFLLTGFSLLGLAAFSIVAVSLPTAVPIKPLATGTYVPAQVVFKVQPGKDPRVIVNKVLARKQTVYRNTRTGKYVGGYDAAARKSPKEFSAEIVQPTLKNIHQLFPKAKITDAVRQKILRRSGAKDPGASYRELGLDRWYVAEVNQRQTDVPTLIQGLEADRSNIEKAEANGIVQLAAVQKITGDNTPPPGGIAQTTTCSNPNDPYSCATGDVYGVTNDQWWLDAINARGAWSLTTGNPNTTIAIVDTGVDWQQADLKNKIWLNGSEDTNHNGCADYWSQFDLSPHVDCHGAIVTTGGDLDGRDNDGNGYTDDVNGMDFFYEASHPSQNDPTDGPADVFGHGTGVAGIAAAETNSTAPEGIAGVCWSCQVMPLAIGTGFGQVDHVSVVRAITYAAMNGADVINLSLTTALASDVQAAITQASTLGVVMVAASGNDNLQMDSSRSYPATDAHVIAVGATNDLSNRWYDATPQSCQGQQLSGGSSWGTSLAVVAPGAKVLTTMGFSGTNLLCVGPTCSAPSKDQLCGIVQSDPSRHAGYFYHTGTSFAAPIVSGLVGLMRSVNPALDPDSIRNILTTTATHDDQVVDENGNFKTVAEPWNPYTGYGLVNAEAAVQQAIQLRPDFAVDDFSSSATQISATQLDLSIVIENNSLTGAKNVDYRVLNAANNAVIYEDRILDVSAQTGAWIAKTITPSSLPTSIKIVIDPLNEFPETFEDNNTSATFTLPAYGTPWFQPLPPQIAREGSLIDIHVVANAPDGAAVQLTAIDKPAGSILSGQTFTWVPPTGSAGQSYSLTFEAKNVATNLTARATTGITVKPPLGGPFVTLINQAFARSIGDGKFVGWSNKCSQDAAKSGRCDSTPPPAYTLAPNEYPLNDIAYIRVKFHDRDGKWDAGLSSPYATVEDNVRARKVGSEYWFDMYPRPGAVPGQANYFAPLKFVEQDDNGHNFGTALFQGWPRTWDQWVSECIYGAGGSQNKNGLGVGAWNELGVPWLTNIGVCLIDDSDGSITPYWQIELHLKSLNQAPVLDPIGNRSLAKRGVPLIFTVHASDANQDVLTYSADALPAGATLDPNTGAFSWTPNYTQAGNYMVTFKAADGQTLAGGLPSIATETITITVNNKAPMVQNLDSWYYAKVGTTYSLPLTLPIAIDPDGDPLQWTYEHQDGAPSGTFTFQPTTEQIGHWWYRFHVSDGAATVTKSFNLGVYQDEPSGGEPVPVEPGLKKPVF